MVTGRPTILTKELTERICEEISTSHKSLKTICEQEGMPNVVTIFRWLNEGQKEGASDELKHFCNEYARAKECQADFLAEEMLEIADDSSQDTIQTENGIKVENREWTNRSRLRVDTRKWIAAKLKPKKYGEKLDITTEGKAINPVITTMKDGQILDGELK